MRASSEPLGKGNRQGTDVCGSQETGDRRQESACGRSRARMREAAASGGGAPRALREADRRGRRQHMLRFARLYDAIDRTTSTNAKVAAMVEYFAAAPAADAAWAVFFLTGRRL